MKFGPYEEHPVAALFPLLRDVDREGFNSLIESIRTTGLIEPIVLDGDLLLDGRNRYLACEVAEVAPRFMQFADIGLDVPPSLFAFDRNMSRRHLTADQRAMAMAEFFKLARSEVNRLKAEAGKQGGKLGGRGHKKTHVPERGQGLDKPKRNARTVDRVAQAAKTSTRKAQQALDVVQHGTPELVASARSGSVKLSDAAHRVGLEKLFPVDERKPPTAKLRRAPTKYTDAALQKLLDEIGDWVAHAPVAMVQRIALAMTTEHQT